MSSTIRIPHAVIGVTFALACQLGCSGGNYYAAKQATPAALAGGAEAVARSAPAAQAGGAAAIAAASTPKLEEKLVIEGYLRLQVEDVRAAATAIRAKVEAAGGRVLNEELSGSATSWRASMMLRLPPAGVGGFLDWIGDVGEVADKRIKGTDVSRTLFDQDIALENLTHTLERLRQLLEREGLAMNDVLAIEQQMTRLRGDIERIKGEQRYLQDRVAMATVSIDLTRKEGPVLGGAKAKFYPGPRISALTLLDRDGRKRTRLGAGLTLHTVAPRKARGNVELDIFEDADGTGRSVLATLGGAAYSDFLGRGRRRFLNPYLGFRLGYGYLDASKFVIGATAGLELFKNRYVMIDANVRMLGLIGKDTEGALVSGGNVIFSF